MAPVYAVSLVSTRRAGQRVQPTRHWAFGDAGVTNEIVEVAG
jgi:hypothetical protein